MTRSYCQVLAQKCHFCSMKCQVSKNHPASIGLMYIMSHNYRGLFYIVAKGHDKIQIDVNSMTEALMATLSLQLR